AVHQNSSAGLPYRNYHHSKLYSIITLVVAHIQNRKYHTQIDITTQELKFAQHSGLHIVCVTGKLSCVVYFTNMTSKNYKESIPDAKCDSASFNKFAGVSLRFNKKPDNHFQYIFKE
ncbi:hypothetical protein N320_05953, partial [Buceros rhinoceros silvestris]